MKKYSAKEIRNVVVLGHTGSGKTTLIESSLFLAGHTKRFGKVDEGNTTSDYDPEEARRQISISASVLPVEWKDTKINFIDTPGFFDFDGEVRQALAVADMAVLVINAKSGIEVGTERAWEYIQKNDLPRIIFVSGMDDEHVDYESMLENLKENFGKSIAPLQEPIIEEGGKFVGYVNIIKKQGRKYVDGRTQDCPIPENLVESVAMLRKMLEESVAETDDALMEKFFDDQDFTEEELQVAKNIGTANGTVTPVLVGAGIHSIGVRVLLNAIIEYVPPTAELCPTVKTTTDQIDCTAEGSLCAFVFKTISDPYVGRLSLFRVYSGVFKKDTPLYNSNTQTNEKISQLYIMRGKEQISVDEISAGDIGAIAKLSATSTGDTLATKEKPYVLPGIDFPKPLYAMGLVPKGKGDEDKISGAISKFLDEDKTLSYNLNRETKQTVIAGLGDSHLDVLINKLRSKYKLEVELTPLVVPFKETIKGKAVGIRGRHKKQSGGAGQFGDVVMDFEPSGDLTQPYVFEEKIFGGAVPRNFFPAVEKGIQESVLAGPLGGYPVVGLKATLQDGSYHAVDSNELSFKLAAIIAFKDGFMKANPVLLEPIYKIEILVPDQYTGDIMGDMNRRRGRILGMHKEDTKQVISVLAPLTEMVNYTIDLRSMTQGRGSFTMEFEQYEEAPRN
ncbi:MAG: elongation factor G [Defluviitaleaceae bacterium]|nr:elongation factor G [Defluviitaleaceae bacterium]